MGKLSFKAEDVLLVQSIRAGTSTLTLGLGGLQSSLSTSAAPSHMPGLKRAEQTGNMNTVLHERLGYETVDSGYQNCQHSP